MMKNFCRIIAWAVLPGLSVILALQNNILQNNYSDLRLNPKYAILFIIMSIIMACYYFGILYYLLHKRKQGIIIKGLLWLSFILFIVGVVLPYHPEGNDVFSIRHVDLVLLACFIYIGILLKYFSLDYTIMKKNEYIIMGLILGAGIIFFLSKKVNSLLELWGGIGMPFLLERLYEQESNLE